MLSESFKAFFFFFEGIIESMEVSRIKCHISFLIKGRLSQINKRSLLINSVIFLGTRNGIELFYLDCI